MTAEIAILNREAVALAADSAVTISGPRGRKIFTSANKIFELSVRQPVGIMIYGDADILRVPWETIIKLYREQLGDRGFKSLPQYAEDFLGFLTSPAGRFFPPEVQADHARQVLHAYLHHLTHEIDRRVEAVVARRGSINDAQIRRIRDAVLKEYGERVDRAPRIVGAPRNYIAMLRRRYSSIADDEIGVVLQRHRPRGTRRDSLRELLVRMLAVLHPTDEDPPVETGIVIAGFGQDDIFPQLRAYSVEGVAADVLKQHPYVGSKISTVHTFASLFPFAQAEMVVRFMEGVDPDYQELIEDALHSVLTQYPELLLQLSGLPEPAQKKLRGRLTKAGHRAFQQIRDRLDAIRDRYYVRPIINLLNSLPKDELAEMAAALVNLTSLKRRFSPDAETVAEPIDVAVISKGDGFVWIKRKHYFPAELNASYFARRQGAPR